MDEGVEAAFLGTRSGLMRFLRYTGIEKRVGRWVRKRLFLNNLQLHLIAHATIIQNQLQAGDKQLYKRFLLDWW